MALTDDQIKLVQASFRNVAPISEAAAELFYARLFQLNPALRPLFHSDLKDQGRKLMQMLSVVVHGLDHMERIGPAAEDLGRRHVSYGAMAQDYQTVGEALLWTLEQGLGADFTPEVREAWAAAYAALAQAAIHGSSVSAN